MMAEDHGFALWLKAHGRRVVWFSGVVIGLNVAAALSAQFPRAALFTLFAFFAGAMMLALVLYLLARESKDRILPQATDLITVTLPPDELRPEDHPVTTAVTSRLAHMGSESVGVRQLVDVVLEESRRRSV